MAEDTKTYQHVFVSCRDCDFTVTREQASSFKTETSRLFQDIAVEGVQHSKDTGHSIMYGDDE